MTKEVVVGIKELAHVLQIPENTAGEMARQGCLPVPERTIKGEFRQKNIWKLVDVLRIKPYVTLTKRELLKILAREVPPEILKKITEDRRC